MSKVKERIEYFDALKGISILFVVFCHNVLLPKGTIFGNYLMALAWLGVPCFMMVSGALSHQKKTFSLKAHFKKLGIMYLGFCAWRAIHVVVCYAVRGVSIGVKGTFQFIFLFQGADQLYAKHMWYICAWFFVMLLFPITWYLFQNKNSNGVKGRKILVYVMCLCGITRILLPSLGRLSVILGRISKVFVFDLSGFDTVTPIGTYANMLFYFILGAFLFEYRETIAAKLGKKKIWMLPICLLAGVGMVVVKAIETGTFYWDKLSIQNGYTRIITVVMSVAAYLFFALYADKFKKLMHFLGKYIGQYTLGIYYMHRLLILLCISYVYPYLKNLKSVWLNLAATIVITVVCILLTALIRKIPVLRKLVG